MKTMKKVGAIVLALCMCMSLCVTAFAASSSSEDEEFTITISNTTQGYTYAAYKIFDVTYDGEGNYAYYITESNPWFNIITSGYTADTTTGVYTTECFVLTPTGTDAGYTVQVKNGVTDSAIIAYFNSVITMTEVLDGDGNGTGVYALTAPEGVTAATTASGNGGTLTLDVTSSGAGYYFVTSTLGATVTITTTDPAASVIDKNTPPGDLEKTMKSLISGNMDSSGHYDTEGMGDDVEFVVTANVPLYAPGDEDSPEGYLVTDYEFDDEMTIGLEIRDLVEDVDYYIEDGKYYATDSLINQWITLTQGETTYYLVTEYDEQGDVTKSGVAYNVVLELLYPSTYTDEEGKECVQFDGFALTYDTIPNKEELDGTTYGTAAEIETNYPVNAQITIDYTAHVTEDVDYENTNHIDMYWHITTFISPNEPEYGGHEDDEDTIIVLQLDLTKIGDGDEANLLAGATFELYGTNLQEVVSNTTYTYTELDKDEYAEAKAAGTELWFEVNKASYGVSFAGSSKYYTNVDPYDLLEKDPNADVSYYVVDDQTYADQDYLYIANTLTVTHSSGLQDAGSDHTVTGTTDENGKLTFIGLTVGDWTLTEIVAPDGYNLLSEELTFTISVSWTTENGVITPVFSIDETGTTNGFSIQNGTVYITIDDESGTILPGTGGMGTTIFYVVGAILICGAAVVLITRRRMAR